MIATLTAALVVSQSQGNDATATRFGSPYKTLGAAKTAAISGDTIVVMDGTFNENGLLKNNVHWHFMVGTKVDYTGPNPPSGTDRAIFDDSGGAVTCRIDGYGEFVWEGSNRDLATSGGHCGGVLWLQNASSVVSLCGYRASIGEFANYGQDTFTILIENCSQFYGNFDIIENQGCNGPFAWFNGSFNLISKIIRAGYSSYSIWAREPEGGVTQNGYIEADLIDNPGYAAVRLEGSSSNYRLWVRAKEIRGQTGGSSLGAIWQSGGGRLYLDAEKINNTSPGEGGFLITQSPAIYLGGGEAWIRAQKITTNLNGDLAPGRYAAQAVTCNATTGRITLNSHGLATFDKVRFGGASVPAGLSAGVWYWVVNNTTNDFQVSISIFGTAIDLATNGTAVTIDSVPWAMFATVISGTLHLDCQHFERVGDYAGDAFAIAGGTLNLRGQMMSQVQNGRGIVYLGGSSRVAGLLIDTSGTNAAGNRPVEVSAPGLVLEQCKLIAPALANSIYAASAQTVTCYSVKANVATNANVTASVDFAVDPNTI